MKYKLLIHHGDTPTPRDPEAWDDAAALTDQAKERP
jgi:hypothetical protein